MAVLNDQTAHANPRPSGAVSSHAPRFRSSPAPATRPPPAAPPGVAPPRDVALCDALRDLGIAPATIRNAVALAARTAEPLDRVFSTGCRLSDEVMARATADVLAIPFARASEIVVDATALEALLAEGIDLAAGIPVRLPDSGTGTAIPCGEASFERVRSIRRAGGRRPVLVTRQALADAVMQQAGIAIAQMAGEGPARTRPDLSAVDGLVRWQRTALSAGTVLAATGLVLAPVATLAVAGILLGVFFLGHTLLRGFAAALGLCRMATGAPRTAMPRCSVLDRELPRYTVLIPLHREAHLLPDIATMIAGLDYPVHKLDIKLLLEASDPDTAVAARAIRWPGHVTVLSVPDLGPKTKPKALNIALPLATGDLIVVYDAEDRPAPDQLRLAAETFAAAPPEVAVLQARLAFFNRTETWLARQFGIEYAAHFGFLLPALEKLDVPIPLGGTSNHIRLDVLGRLGGWDPYNVTEDADLGIRLHALGYRTRMIDSVTDEEAACHWRTWIGQRTRWQKGWLQTWGVHMRRPLALLRTLGLLRFIGFQLMIGGQIVSPVAHAGFVTVAAIGLCQGWLLDFVTDPETRLVAAIAAINLFGGYGASMGLGYAAILAERWDGMRRQVPAMPVYWLAISWASVKAAFDLARRPFHWEKTQHGISSQCHQAGRSRAPLKA